MSFGATAYAKRSPGRVTQEGRELDGTIVALAEMTKAKD
jgi:hypothetical protein